MARNVMENLNKVFMVKEEILDYGGDVISEEYIIYLAYCEMYEVKLRFESKKEMITTVNNPVNFLEKLKPHLADNLYQSLIEIGYYEIDDQKIYISGY